MNHKVARDRNRASPGSSSLTPTFRKSVSLDAILKADQRFTPDNCFGLDVPYRNNPRYHFQPIPKGAGIPAGSPLSPRSPRRVWGSPVSGLPMVKSSSLPEFDLHEKFGIAGTRPSASCPPVPVGPWSCKACGTTDQNMRQPGPDSTWSCFKCGAEAEGPAMRDLERPSNCPKEKDPQQVNDGAPRTTAKDAATVALASGPQSASERRNMMNAYAGGTQQMAHRTLKKSGLLNGGNAIHKVAIKSLMDQMEDRARNELTSRGILLQAEKLFALIPGLDDRVAKHIRFALIRTYTASMVHASKCRQKGCMLALSANTNTKLIAYSVTEQTMQDLINASKLPEPPSDDTVQTLARLTTGTVTVEQLEGQLTRAKQLKLKYGSPMNRLMALSAISMISRWSDEDACKPCPTPAPAALRQPPSIALYPGEYGKPARPDPGDVTVKLRDNVDDLAGITKTRGDVRNTALMYLAEPKTVAFLTKSDLQVWSVGVMACLLLTCSALKMGHNDYTEGLRQSLLDSENISKTTFAGAVTELAAIMEDHKPSMADELFPCGTGSGN